MIRIPVSASRDYEVLISRGLLDRAGELLRPITRAETAVIVSGDKVWPLYGRRLVTSLEDSGFRVLSFVIPLGEQRKNLETYGQLLRFLSENRLTRGDVLIALGGGVAGDLTGFAAATYQRGMDYVQVPTTLLAMVDSSVGGKTAVNLETGKNQVGAFYQPCAVLCDPALLESLPEEERLCGCGEVIKYGVLGDAAFFEKLEKSGVREDLEHVIETCVMMKRDIVARDEFDRGQRRLLNLGHTFGHAVEAVSGFQIPHGQAVAIGLAIICRASAAKGIMDPAQAERVIALLRRTGLPTETEYAPEELIAALHTDKKILGQTLNLVVPEAIGRCSVLAVPVSAAADWLAAGGVR